MRLPPLNAVRAFEAAGRLGNFSKAASELGVTPGAVSRQIRKLEDHLGKPLFVRAGTEVHLTEDGRSFLKSAQDAFSGLEASTECVRGTDASQPLHIWGSRFFIRLWLIPRLPEFHRQHPDREVLITSAMPSDPMPSEFDVAIKLGDGHWPGYRSDLLIERSLVPVCSPGFLKANPRLKRPEDLQNAVLIQTPLGADEWNKWYAQTDSPVVPLPHRMTFTSTDLAYSAALDGVGIVLGRRGFFESDIDRGNLVMPFATEFRAGDGFYLIYSKRVPLPKRVSEFKAWVRQQVRR